VNRESRSRDRIVRPLSVVSLAAIWVVSAATVAAEGPAGRPASVHTDSGTAASAEVSKATKINRPADLEKTAPAAAVAVRAPFRIPGLDGSPEMSRTIQNVALFGLISLAPAAVLMVTSFVRINIVLILLRQALGSPQVPGNQVLTALALLLTALVMRPVGELIYRDAIVPYQSNKLSAEEAWKTGSQPIKAFMVGQIVRYKHEHYLRALDSYASPSQAVRHESAPADVEDFPLRVVAPAYLLSELTTAFMMGFYLYLPFLVIDLVVSSVLAATGLFMLPPALVAMPLKLIVFVLADGWLLVATMLLSSFNVASTAP
jgi:flagellar biosynthesis protein FliP